MFFILFDQHFWLYRSLSVDCPEQFNEKSIVSCVFAFDRSYEYLGILGDETILAKSRHLSPCW
jgi:hypothetical protein